MIQRTAGIVLHTIKYNDTSNIVDVYTKAFGRLSFIVSIPKTHKSSIKSTLFQPLAILEIESDIQPTRQLNRIKQVKSLYPFSSIQYDGQKMSIAFFLAEFLQNVLKVENEDSQLFDYLINSIIWLDNCEESYSNFHIVFLMRLSRFLGFRPNLQDYDQGDYFDLLNSCYVNQKPLIHKMYLEPEEAAQIYQLMRINYNTMHLLRMSRSQRNRCIQVIIEYYRIHIPEFPELKSLDVLRELFD